MCLLAKALVAKQAYRKSKYNAHGHLNFLEKRKFDKTKKLKKITLLNRSIPNMTEYTSN